MPDPSTSTVVIAVSGVGLATLLPGIDGNALIGAFAGATVFVVSAKELTIFKRIAYMLASLIMGYQAAPEIMHSTSIRESGVAASLAAALFVTVTIGLIEKAKSFELLSWLRRGGKKDE